MEDFVYTKTITTAGTTYSSTFDHADTEIHLGILETLNVTTVTGTNVTINVTPQISLDGSLWFDGTAFAEKTATGSELIENNKVGAYRRYKMVVAGDVVTSVVLEIKALAR